MCIMIMLLYRLRGCVVYRWRYLVRFWIILMEMIGIQRKWIRCEVVQFFDWQSFYGLCDGVVVVYVFGFFDDGELELVGVLEGLQVFFFGDVVFGLYFG